jgi:hypothetical protein
MVMIKTIAILLLNIAIVSECYITSLSNLALPVPRVPQVLPKVPPKVPPKNSKLNVPYMPKYKGRKIKLLNDRWENINNTSEYIFEFLAILDILATIK